MTASSPISRQAWGLSFLSKLVCVAALGALTYRTYQHFLLFPQDTRLILLLVAEALTITLVVVSKPTEQIVRRPFIMLVTVVSSCYFLLVDLENGILLVPPLYGRLLQLSGIVIELLAKIWIWNRFGLLPANRGLVTTGPYKVVRHPMYLGYMMAGVGFLVCAFSLRNLVLYTVLFLMIMYRILKEEEYLRRDPEYVAYSERVSFRLLPFVF